MVCALGYGCGEGRGQKRKKDKVERGGADCSTRSNEIGGVNLRKKGEG